MRRYRTACEFESESALRTVFATGELALYQNRLLRSDSRDMRIHNTITYLVRQRLRGDRPGASVISGHAARWL